MTRRCVRARITGRVQGVGFRYATLREAQRAGVAGWVRNLADGRVEVWAEGESGDVDRLLDWLRKGPRFAGVERVEQAEGEPAGVRGFDIRSTYMG